MTKETEQKNTLTIDATGISLGRVATQAAFAIMGKDKVSFERHKFSGSPVLVQNASKMIIHPKKMKSMEHKRYSGYPGGLKLLKWSYIVKTKGYSELVRHAVKGMLPKNKLQKEMLKNLTVEE